MTPATLTWIFQLGSVALLVFQSIGQWFFTELAFSQPEKQADGSEKYNLVLDGGENGWKAQSARIAAVLYWIQIVLLVIMIGFVGIMIFAFPDIFRKAYKELEMSTTFSTIMVILILGWMVLLAFRSIGQWYFTELAFGKAEVADGATKFSITLTENWQVQSMKIAAVLYWVSVLLTLGNMML